MGYSHENLLYACSAFHYYLGSLRYLQQYREAARNESDQNDIVTAAIHYMKENLEKKITLADLATHIGYSPSHFSVLFSKRTGYAPPDLFQPTEDTTGLPATGLYGYEGKPDLL